MEPTHSFDGTDPFQSKNQSNGPSLAVRALSTLLLEFIAILIDIWNQQPYTPKSFLEQSVLESLRHAGPLVDPPRGWMVLGSLHVSIYFETTARMYIYIYILLLDDNPFQEGMTVTACHCGAKKANKRNHGRL
jgi:hypothetical protein